MRNDNKFKVTIGTFDWVKGMGMICIVVGHLLNEYSVSLQIFSPIMIPLKILSAGLMPMFFLINGYSFKSRSIYDMFNKSTKGLLKPYIYVAIAVICIFPIIHYLLYRWWPGAVSETVRYIVAFVFGLPCVGMEIFGISAYSCSVAWFLLAMFLTHNILNIILKIQDQKLQIVMVMGCVLIGYACAINKIWYFCIPQGFLATGYSYLGYLMKKTKLLQKKIPIWVYMILIFISVAELIWGEYNLANSIYKRGILDYIGSIATGLLFMRCAFFANYFENVVSEAVKIIGRYSYWIIGLHAWEMVSIPWYEVIKKFGKQAVIGFFVILFFKINIIYVGCCVLKKITKLRYKKISEKKKGEL